MTTLRQGTKREHSLTYGKTSGGQSSDIYLKCSKWTSRYSCQLVIKCTSSKCPRFVFPFYWVTHTDLFCSLHSCLNDTGTFLTAVILQTQPSVCSFFFLSSHTYTPHDHSVRLQWVKEEQQPALDKSTQCAHGLVLWICPHLPLDQHSLLHSTTNLNNALNHQSTFSWVPHVLENMEHWWPVCGAVAKGLVATILCHITVSAIIPIIIYCIQCLLYSTINVNAVQCCARCLFALCFLTSWGRSDQT